MKSPVNLDQKSNSFLGSLLERSELPPEDIRKVQQALNGVEIATNPDFPPDVNERLLNAGESAQSAFASIKSPWPVIYKLIGAAQASKTAGMRVQWLQKASIALANAYGPASACKPGCSHCCHIPVKLTQSEAVELGKAIKRKPEKITGMTFDFDDSKFNGQPCTFLVNSECSIYEDRPSVCRTHMNMDKDELLCKTVPGMNVPVPYLDVRPITLSRVITGGRNPVADIREWFKPTD
jgi:Fe-S-cluster containining protein